MKKIPILLAALLLLLGFATAEAAPQSDDPAQLEAASVKAAPPETVQPEAPAAAPAVETGNTRRAGAFGRPNEMAPDETEQFAFMVGAWDCTTRSLKRGGSGYTESTARWVGYYILGGWAIQDDWSSPAPGGLTFHGTNIRSFNPQTGKWDNRWLAAGTLQWKYYEAEKVGEAMVMTGGEGEDQAGKFVDRNTFYDIAENSWKWRKDRTYDGGKNWIEGVSFIEALRVGSQEPAAAEAGGASAEDPVG